MENKTRGRRRHVPASRGSPAQHKAFRQEGSGSFAAPRCSATAQAPRLEPPSQGRGTLVRAGEEGKPNRGARAHLHGPTGRGMSAQPLVSPLAQPALASQRDAPLLVPFPKGRGSRKRLFLLTQVLRKPKRPRPAQSPRKGAGLDAFGARSPCCSPSPPLKKHRD